MMADRDEAAQDGKRPEEGGGVACSDGSLSRLKRPMEM